MATSTQTNTVTLPVHKPLVLPSANPPKRIFYCDPAKGSSKGDGSAAKPWKTLAEVVAAKLIGKAVLPGDAIYLLSGNHGSVSLAGDNSDFITIKAAPNNTPVLNQLSMKAANRWQISGLTFENPPGPMPANYVLVRITPCDNLIFTDNVIRSQLDISKWTPADWAAQASFGMVYSGNGAVITGNQFSSTTFGFKIGSTGVVSGDLLIADNSIDCFASDALQFTASDTIIRGNVIANHYPRLDNGNHNDAIQGYPIDGLPKGNVIIEGNRIVESTGTYAFIPAMPTGIEPDIMQGISIFDGDWSDVTIRDNVIVSSAYHGISLYGAKRAAIVNNTVLDANPQGKQNVWIGVFARKDGAVSENVTVRNNIAHSFNLKSSGFISDHNISILADKSMPSGFDPAKLFRKYSPATGEFDLGLFDANPALGSGSADGGVPAGVFNIGASGK